MDMNTRAFTEWASKNAAVLVRACVRISLSVNF